MYSLAYRLFATVFFCIVPAVQPSTKKCAARLGHHRKSLLGGCGSACTDREGDRLRVVEPAPTSSHAFETDGGMGGRYPSYSDALRFNVIKGLGSYCLEDNHKYWRVLRLARHGVVLRAWWHGQCRIALRCIAFHRVPSHCRVGAFCRCVDATHG
jgi:hypothetical protein